MKLPENLILLDGIFEKNNSEYWLSCGTLLGFHRDDDFIGHDHDTDLCVNIKSLNKSLLEEILTNGFEIRHVFGRLDKGFELTLSRKNIQVDLFFFYKNEGNWYHCVYSNFNNNFNNRNYYTFKPFGLKRKEFLGYSFSVPDDIEGVLIQQYGPSWEKPNKNWSYYKSPLNVTNTNE